MHVSATPTTRSSAARSAAIEDLFQALDRLMTTYQALPQIERTERWSADADRITGEIARHLHGARRRVSANAAPPRG